MKTVLPLPELGPLVVESDRMKQVKNDGGLYGDKMKGLYLYVNSISIPPHSIR